MPISQTFSRGSSRPGRVCEFESGPFARSNGIPLRPPSDLPSPGHKHLSIALGDVLGKGRAGTVHCATLITPDYTDLPPLVAKVWRHRRSETIEREAWFYEELEKVQGIAVPRCYGLFQTHIEWGTEVLAWNNKIDPNEPSEDSMWMFTGVKEKTEEDPTLLSILLLERLGGRIPLRQADYTDIKSDVYEIYDDIGKLGIEHIDFRWSNILSVTEDSDHPPSKLICPNHGHAHQWRIIDFHLARKTNATPEYLHSCFDSHLRRLFNNAPYGITVEPWE
ncbi:hypothetical protein Clacol_008646 [Clathrus columnatus]|uniref:Protein kinase domain-containing protein n=1 Tax=Clathrus columnatus TaxID=1419009 RepID=A0AAV5AL31_9AGAM|nr:hypothetical protein Clacol_008646 [Clathrus columnatus]